METSFCFGLQRERFPELFTAAEKFFSNESGGSCFNADVFFQDWSAQIFSLEPSEHVLPTRRFNGGERGVFYINVLGQVFSSVEEVLAWHWTDYFGDALPLIPHHLVAVQHGNTPLTNSTNLAINLARALQYNGVQISLDRVAGALQVSLWFPSAQQQQRFAVGEPVHASDKELYALQEELTRWMWFAETGYEQHVGIHFPNGQTLTLMYSPVNEMTRKLANMNSFAPITLPASPQFLQCIEQKYATEVMVFCSEAFANQCLVQVCLCLVGKPNPAVATSVPLVPHGDAAKQVLIGDALQQRVWNKFKLSVSNEAMSSNNNNNKKKQVLPCSVCCEMMVHITWQLCPTSKAQAYDIAKHAAGKALHHCLSKMNQARLEQQNSLALRSAASSMASILMHASPLTKQTALELCNYCNGDLELVIFNRLLDLQRGNNDDEYSDDADTVIFDE